MAILSVTQGLVEVEGGKVFELDSSKGLNWLESVKSFRYEPTGQNKPYTARKETGKGGEYWYGYRKQDGKLHKKYIGKSSEVYTGKLEEVAEALNTPTQPRVTDKAVVKVAEKVTDSSLADRVTALESVVKTLQQSLDELTNSLFARSSEAPQETATQDGANIQVTDNELHKKLQTDSENELHNKLQIAIGNLQDENEKLTWECQELRSQLEQAQKAKEVAEPAPAVMANCPQLPDLKTAYEGYKKEKKPGRVFTISELKPFYAAILKGLTPDKGN